MIHLKVFSFQFSKERMLFLADYYDHKKEISLKKICARTRKQNLDYEIKLRIGVIG